MSSGRSSCIKRYKTRDLLAYAKQHPAMRIVHYKYKPVTDDETGQSFWLVAYILDGLERRSALAAEADGGGSWQPLEQAGARIAPLMEKYCQHEGRWGAGPYSAAQLSAVQCSAISF
jgi:hypothetical protein